MGSAEGPGEGCSEQGLGCVLDRGGAAGGERRWGLRKIPEGRNETGGGSTPAEELE